MNPFIKIPLVVLILIVGCKEGKSTEIDYRSPKFNPSDTAVLFMLDWSRNEEMATYIKRYPNKIPAGFAYYTNLNFGIPNADFNKAKAFASSYGKSSIQFAIWTGGNYSSQRLGYYLDQIV